MCHRKRKVPKQAEQAAARKYLNNNFMSGENPPQAEIEVPSQKKNIPPKQIRKQKKRMEKISAKKKAESEAGSRTEGVGESDTQQNPVIIPQEDAIRKCRPGLLVYFDLARATESEASEMSVWICH